MLYRRLDDPFGVANSELLLGHAVADEGDFALAQDLFEASARGFQEIGDDHYTLAATRLAAWTYDELGDRAHSRSLYELVVRRAREAHNKRMEAMSLGPLAEYALDDGHIQEAGLMLARSTRLLRDVGDRS